MAVKRHPAKICRRTRLMLEYTCLLVHPWRDSGYRDICGDAAAHDNTSTRTIIDVATGATVGFAGWRGGGPLWFPPFRRSSLEVYETEDASLLCTARRRRLSRWWEVRDAEGQQVGSFRSSTGLIPRRVRNVQDGLGNLRRRIRGVWAKDRQQQPLASIGPPSPQSQIIGPEGTPIGSVCSVPEGARLEFSTTLANDPFTKMVLLAAVLTHY
jgi:hypothetical protein